MQVDLAGSITIETARRDDMLLRALATLRMTVFRSWPYLYDGNLDYEADYLAKFLSDDAAVLAVARLGEIPVGMATASPMATQADTIKTPFINAGLDIDRLFYFGESVLLPQFHGLGIGHRFFDEREAAARRAGASGVAFCAVVQDADHPSRPEKARDLATFWNARGFRSDPSLTMIMRWKEVGRHEESDHLMRFWLKQL